jgi:hypothetical protein
MVNRSGLIEMTITEDSIITRKLFPDFKVKENKNVESIAYVEFVKLDDRILLIKKNSETAKFTTITMANLSNKQCQIIWNVPDTVTTDVETLVEIHRNDNRKLFGYNMYSREYIDSLKKMKPIESMTLMEFQDFMSIYIRKIKETESDFEIYNKAYLGFSSYNFQIISQSLLEFKVNPIQNIGTVDEIFKKYYNDPKVQLMVEESKKK